MNCSLKAIVLALLLSAQVFALSIDYQIGFDAGDFYFTQENGYDIVNNVECARYGEVGEPQMFAKSLQFIIPVDMTVTSITVTTADYEKLEGVYNVFPTQPDLYYYSKTSMFEPPEWVEPETTIYQSSSLGGRRPRLPLLGRRNCHLPKIAVSPPKILDLSS
jgi:hypothetical protein